MKQMQIILDITITRDAAISQAPHSSWHLFEGLIATFDAYHSMRSAYNLVALFDTASWFFAFDIAAAARRWRAGMPGISDIAQRQASRKCHMLQIPRTAQTW